MKTKNHYNLLKNEVKATIHSPHTINSEKP